MGVFTETDAAVLYDTVINKLQEDIGETLYPGDERRIFGESMVAWTVIVFNTVDDVTKQSMLRYARGTILDAIGDGYDCTRMEAGKAITMLKFSLSSTYSADIIIPEGTRAATEDGKYFATDKEVNIPAGQTSVVVSASATEGGTAWNGYLEGTVNIMVDLLSYVDEVTNTVVTDSGTERETDDDYRERIRLSLTKFSTAGPKNAWRYWAMSADPGIADAHVKLVSANNVSITIIMKDGEAADETVVEKVLAAVSADDVKPLGDMVTVSPAEESVYDIELKYYVSSENEAAAVNAIEEKKYTDSEGTERIGAIEKYRLWQDTTIARDINPDKLKALIMNPAGDGTVPGADRVVITKPVFTELTGEIVAHFSGNISITHEVNDDK